VTVAAIRHGERLLRRMLELAARFLVRATRLVSAYATPDLPAAMRRDAPTPLAPQFRAGVRRHRGPPVRFAL